MTYSDSQIEDITQQIDNSMRSLFIETCRIYQLEREFNYENYGRYPYRDRKNSVQIFADFNAMAYSVNGLFVEESEYTRVYPSVLVPKIDQVLINVAEVLNRINIFTVFIGNASTGAGDVIQGTFQQYLDTIQNYGVLKADEYVEIEDTTVQTIRYLFPFTASQLGNATVLSL